MTVPDIVSKQVYSTYEHKLDKAVRAGHIPQHIGIIMDGNRRYAKEFLDSDIDEGHRLGEKKIESVMDWCLDLGVKYVTLYAFSSENFKRDREEVDFLMDLAESSFLEMADNPKIHKHRVAIRAIGKIEALPENVRKAIDYAYEKTKDYDQFTISICLAYGGRQEIVEAVKEIAAKIEAGDMAVEEITEKVISSHLYTGDMPDPDLILRTSGEIRAIRSYQQRKRRYGE